jgi:hypothetical protein
MPSQCPWCLEPLGLRQRRADTCPHCGKPLAGDSGELRTIDLRYDEVRAAQEVRFREVLWCGLAVVIMLFFVLPLVNLVVPILALSHLVAVPVVLAAHLITVSLALTRRTRRLLSPARHLFLRWITRLTFLWAGGIGYGLTGVPFLGAVVGAGTYAGLTYFAHRYSLWSLERERERRPLAGWEKLALLALVALTVLLLVVLVGGALLLGWGVSKLLEMVSA